MGGATSGGMASEMAVDFLTEKLNSESVELTAEQQIKDFMLDIVKQCNELILKRSQNPEQPVTMGTTVVMALIKGNKCHLVHAGDSRAYILRKNDLTQVTHDHSIVQELLDSGKITPAQAQNHPNKNIITSALGVDANTRVDYKELPVGKNEMLLVCSDGLTNMVREEDIISILKEPDFFRTADHLIDKAVEAGGLDNITAVVVSI